MTEFLDRDDILTAGALAVGHALEIRDFGLLDAAAARPQTTVYGVDAYPDLYSKAAALLQLLARNHAVTDSNKRTAWAAAWTFLHINGVELAAGFDVDAAETFMNDVAQRGELTIDEIAGTMASFAA